MFYLHTVNEKKLPVEGHLRSVSINLYSSILLNIATCISMHNHTNYDPAYHSTQQGIHFS
jgi:hypothetical protein